MQDMLKNVPEHLWSKHDTDVGLVKSAEPVSVQIKPNARFPFRQQYPLKPEAEQGIQKTIDGLMQAGVLVEVESQCNTPIFPVLKADKNKYRLVHDLREINKIIVDAESDVPNPNTLLNSIPSEAYFFTVIDLCSAFFSIPLAEESQHLFAFTYRGKKLSYTRLPQGFKLSPHIFNQVLKNDLEGLNLTGTVLQYVDDLLICGNTLNDCHQDSIKVLQRLAEGGHKVSKQKLQYCQPQVDYLGRQISQGTVGISPSQLEGVSKAPSPRTVGEMMTFLGMTGFNADWIENYAEKSAPLRELIKETGNQSLKAVLKWTTEAKIAFETLKQEMQVAPTLALPNYDKQFYLYVANRKNMYASAVLMQETCVGRRKQAIAYYSTKLDNVAQGWPPCYQGLAAVYYAYEKASTITMGYPVTIQTHHKITELINQGKFVMTQARCLQYMPLLTYPDVTVQRCTTNNPADMVPLHCEGEPHECLAETMKFTRLRPDLESTPIMNAEVTYFVDGSCFRDHLGNHAGYAVVKQVGDNFVTVKAEKCEQPCSAQKAELKALTEACKLAKGKVANIFTDSAYAHGVCYLFAAVWKQRGFKRADGSPVLHQEQLKELIASMMLPSRLAVIKCNAHRKGNDLVIKGNNAADEAAKLASKCQMAILAPVVTLEPMVTPEDIILMQQEAGESEHSLWAQRGATMSENGLWRSQSGHLVAPVALLTMLVSEAHGLDHCGRGKVMEKLKKQGYWSPYMQAMVDEILSQCEICAENNVRKGIKSPIGHIPVPEGPFKHLVIDYVDMIKPVQGKRYMLVVIDRFSRWVEAVPSKTLGAETVIKFLTREVIPRFGIPSEISSDNGSAFIQKVLKGVLLKLGIKQRFGAIYHPQSEGIVERINGTLKAKLNKICASTNLNWADALPLALMSYRMQMHRSTHLTPHEMLTGRTMPVPEWRLPFKGPALEQLQTELKAYMDQLTAIHRAIYLQEKARSSCPESVVKRPVEPGDLVYVKVFRRKWNSSRWDGPFEVKRATATAVQVQRW
ncbi:protein NYNRIN-like [Fundulus heteroclitus]|uniref:protein NYNRIN-like n=1 Tax=Fundulus heteroclitus TaxID=8078 RepID=UPI00165B5890|nr:protein NYNRIN-like [Fundulus heteroclitus]